MSSGRVASLVCMTTPTTALPGRPPVVDLATWQAARDELLVREKAHTRAGDALAADRRRLPMVEIDGTTEVVGADGPVPFLDLFQGRDELVIYHHMWHDGVPHQGQCAGCTFNVWQMKDTVYLKARGVSFAILTSGRWDEVATLRRVHGLRPALVLGTGCGGADRHGRGPHRLLPARRRPRVPHLPHDRPRQRARRRERRPAGHDALRSGRGVGGQPRGLARGTPLLLVLGHRPGRATPPGARPAAPRRSGPARTRPPWTAPASKARRHRIGGGIIQPARYAPGPPPSRPKPTSRARPRSRHRRSPRHPAAAASRRSLRRRPPSSR